jgi:hypothetical protein
MVLAGSVETTLLDYNEGEDDNVDVQVAGAYPETPLALALEQALLYKVKTVPGDLLSGTALGELIREQREGRMRGRKGEEAGRTEHLPRNRCHWSTSSGTLRCRSPRKTWLCRQHLLGQTKSKHQ